MLLIILGTACFGMCVAVGSYAGSATFERGLDLVESDLREKLRRLRVNTRNLRRLLISWLIGLFFDSMHDLFADRFICLQLIVCLAG